MTTRKIQIMGSMIGWYAFAGHQIVMSLIIIFSPWWGKYVGYITIIPYAFIIIMAVLAKAEVALEKNKK